MTLEVGIQVERIEGSMNSASQTLGASGEKLVGDINRQIGSIDAALAAANDRFSSSGDRIAANIDEKVGERRRPPVACQ